MRINVKERSLIDFSFHPPRYDVHSFTKPPKRLPTIAERRTAANKAVSTMAMAESPRSLGRGGSDDAMSFGYDLSSSTSVQTGLQSDADEIRSVPPSEPPSPSCLTQAKLDATRQLALLGKSRTSDEGGLSAVALGVGLLI